MSNIIDLPYNLSKYIQHKHSLKIVWILLFISTHCTLITTVYFKDQNWISKTVYCIRCLMVCKVTFCSKFPDIPDKTGRKREVEEHRQLQSVMHFTRMQKTNFKVISVVAKRIATNYIVYIDSCIPKHIIYQHSHKKGNLLIAILKKKKYWY